MKAYRREVENHAKSETEKHIAFIGLTGKEAEAYRAGSSLGCTVSCQYLDIPEKKINTKRS